MMMFYICTKFYENVSKGFRVVKHSRFLKSKITKGLNFTENGSDVTALISFSAHRMMMLYICTKFPKDIPKGSIVT